MAFNVGVLAESLDARLTSLSSEVELMAAETGWLALRADMAVERAARRQIRKLTAKKREEA